MEEIVNEEHDDNNENITSTSLDDKKGKSNNPRHHISRYDGGNWIYDTQGS